MNRGLFSSSRLSVAVAMVGPALLIGFLAWPMLFTSSGMAQDWSSHLWEVWKQSETISRDHAPSLFLNDAYSVFVPFYGYYGGTLFTLGGALSLALGGPVRGYVLSYLLGFAAAYGGWYWLARMAGLGRWLANVPGFVFITSGYYLTLVYARGDWPEFMAVSVIPLLAAGAVSVLSADRLRALPTIALTASTVVFFGSHNITMLWGGTVLAVLALVLLAAVAPARKLVTRAGLIRVSLVVVPAALVNAWFLLPALAYGSRTRIAHNYGLGLASNLYLKQGLVAAKNLFTFSRAGAVPDTPGFVLALPLLAIVWILAAALITLRSGRDSPWRRVLLIVSGVTVVVALLMTHVHVLLDLPRAYQLVQFSYRLETYVVLGLCAAMLAALVLLGNASARTSRISCWALLAAIVASGIGAVQQVDTHYTGLRDRSSVFIPSRSLFFQVVGIQNSYTDTSLPVIAAATLPQISFPAESIHDDHITVRFRPPAGARQLSTNLGAPPYFVTVSGARVVGRDARVRIVLELTGGGGQPLRTISLRRAESAPIVLGRVVTLLALAYWVIALAIVLGRRLRSTRVASVGAKGASSDVR